MNDELKRYLKEKQDKIERRLSVLSILNSKFDIRIEENKHHYNDIKDPYILILKMLDDISFICCGLSQSEGEMFKKEIKRYEEENLCLIKN